MIARIFSGTARPDVDRLQALSRFYGVPMEALLSDDPLPAPGESPAPSGEKPAGMKAAGEGNAAARRETGRKTFSARTTGSGGKRKIIKEIGT